MNRLRSIRSILILAFTVSLLLPIAIVLYYVHTITGQSLAEQALDNHLHDVELQAQHIEQSLLHIRDDAIYVTRLRSLRQFEHDSTAQSELEQDLIVFATSNQMIQQIIIATDEYRIGIDNSTTTPRLIDADVLSNTIYLKMMTSYSTLGTGQYRVFFDFVWNRPVLRYVLGTDSGFVMLDVDAGWVFRNMPDVQQNRIWAIINQQGQHLLFPLPNETYAGAIPVTDAALADYLPQLLTTDSGTVTAQRNTLIYSHIYPTGQSAQHWILYQQVPKSDLLAVVNDFYRTSTLIFGVALVVIVIIGGYIAGQIIPPIRALQSQVHQFASGKPISKYHKPLPITELNDLHLNFTQMATQLESERQQKQQLIKRLITAQEDERKRIAYDLHDGLIQQLVGAKMYVAMLKGRVDASNQAEVVTSEEALKQAIVEGRRILQGLHPTILDDLGLVDAIAELAQQQAKQYGWTLSLNLEQLTHEPHKSVAITIFRIVQEALNNIAKHAHATTVQIQLSNGNSIQLTITDNGTGFDMDSDTFSTGLGLGTMVERATSLSGDCKIVSASQHGTTITIYLPFN